jgi:hypothetical protein
VNRVLPLLLAGLLTLAAAPDTGLPVPPVPPSVPPTDTAAPRPDDSLRAPVVLADQDPLVRLQLFRMQRHDSSQGFLPGSRYESTEDRKAIQTPGLTVTVPLN